MFVDEGTLGGNRALAGNLKTRVTEPWVILERKGVDAVKMRNRMIFMISSNEASVVPTDKADRRWMVFDVGEDHREDKPYFAAIEKQPEDGGYESMLYDLLHRDIRAGPDPRQIIRTEALFEQVLLAQGPELRYVHHLLDTGRLPQNIVAGAAFTTIKALATDLRSQHFDSGYINDIRLGKLLRQMIPGIRTAISGRPTRPMDLVQMLGRNVRAARQARRMSQEQLAFEAEMKPSYVSDLEPGTRNPSVRALGRLAKALDVEPADLLRHIDKAKE